MVTLQNEAPKVYGKTKERRVTESELNDAIRDEFDSREIFGKKLADI